MQRAWDLVDDPSTPWKNYVGKKQKKYKPQEGDLYYETDKGCIKVIAEYVFHKNKWVRTWKSKN